VKCVVNAAKEIIKSSSKGAAILFAPMMLG